MRLPNDLRFAICLFISLCAATAWSQNATTADDATTAKDTKAAQADALKKFGKEAAKYEMRFRRGDELFKLNETSIMNWTNPARRGENGAIYLWMNNGRPEAIGSIFTYVYNDFVGDKHEFHSLVTKPLEAMVEGDAVWTPKNGLNFKPIPNAQPPASSFVRRKIQMKLLAKRFSGVLHDQQSGNANTGTASNTNLRLIPTPLVIYEPENQACKAGSIFSLAYGTDPEILVVIECRQDKEDDGPTWKYALARYHYMGVTAKLDDEKVWSAPHAPENLSNLRSTSDLRGESYISFYPR